jgi:transcriptional regulator with XRE-family HTH domain
VTDHEDSPHLDEDEQEIYRLSVVNRLTQRRIAERLGISQQRVSQVLAKAREKLPPIDLDDMRRHSLELHMDIQRRALELAELAGAPMTAGKDGAIVYDTDGNVVRDYAGRVAALRLAKEADIEIRKLHGLDAASKIVHSGSVRYEVAGVDIQELT